MIMYAYIDRGREVADKGETGMGRIFDVLLADASEEYRILMKDIIPSTTTTYLFH